VASGSGAGSEDLTPGDPNDPDKPGNNDKTPYPGPQDGTTIEQTFLVSFSATAKEIFSLTATGLSHLIPLVESTKKQTFSQVNRAQITKEFQQGYKPSDFVDNFNQQSGSGIVDILIVMDNSGSMEYEQANMSTKMLPLLSSLNNASWKIGVVTTDKADSCMRSVITKGEADAETKFKTAMKAGHTGSGTERGLYQAVKGLSCPGMSWLRTNSSLAVLIVSDEDNCSNNNCGSSTEDNAQESPSYLLNYISSDLGRELGKKARVYGLIWHPSQTQAQCPTGLVRGTTYASAISTSGGKWGSICASDYSATLNSISQDIAVTLESQFVLSYAPNAGSVQVKVTPSGGTETAWTGFTVTGNVLTFTNIPPQGSKIKVSYNYGGIPTTKRFALGERPADGTLKVFVNSSLVAGSMYTLGSDNVVEFNTAPADNAKIKMEFLKNTPLKDEFTIGKVALHEVSVGGVVTTDYTYDYDAGILKFSKPPVDKAAIVIKEGETTYPFAPLGDNPRDFEGTLVNSKKKIAVVVSGGTVTIDPKDYVVGEKLLITYNNDNSFLSELELKHVPLPGTLNFATKDLPGCDPLASVYLNGKTLYWDCEFDDGELTVEYEYAVPREPSKFTIKNPYDPDLGQWEVRVNGVVVTDYKRSGNIIKFPNVLPEFTPVTVKVVYESRRK
jgi:hypothetical protein